MAPARARPIPPDPRTLLALDLAAAPLPLLLKPLLGAWSNHRLDVLRAFAWAAGFLSNGFFLWEPGRGPRTRTRASVVASAFAAPAPFRAAFTALRMASMGSSPAAC